MGLASWLITCSKFWEKERIVSMITMSTEGRFDFKRAKTGNGKIDRQERLLFLLLNCTKACC